MNPADEGPRVVRFGSYEADLRSGELRKQGVRVKLQEQPFRVLTMLLERPGELVSREELRARLWPSDTFVDFDNSLNTDINKLREALGDSAGNPRFVETVPRRGYRFVAPVDLETPPEAPAGPAWWQSRSAQLGMAMVGLLVVTISTTYLVLTRRGGVVAGSENGTVALAVLPLENLSHDPEQKYFVDGLTDLLISSLARVGSLRTISRTSVMQYKKARKNLKDVARELNVGLVLEGSVFQNSDHVRINATLIQAKTDTNLWSGQYDRDLQDVLVLQNEVARDIAREVHLKLTPEEEGHLSNARRVNREAYQAYLKGRYYVSRATKEDLERAAVQFHKAIAADPTYALAYDGIAAYYLVADEYLAAPWEILPQAKQAATKAQQLDDTLAEPHNSLGMIHYWHDWDWAAAESEFRRAIELNPNYALAHSYLGWTMATQGRFQEAYQEMKRAQELDPLSPEVNAYVGWILYFMGRDEEAAQQLLKTIAMDREYWLPYVYLGRVYEKKGMLNKAIEQFEKARRIESSIPELLAALGRAYALSGRRGEAVNVLERLKAMRKQQYVPAYPEAVVFAGLGMKDEAMERLEKAYEERSYYITWLKIDPQLDSLRSDARFRDLMRRVPLPQ